MARAHDRLTPGLSPALCGVQRERDSALRPALTAALLLICLLQSIASADSRPVTEGTPAESAVRDSATADSVAPAQPSDRVVLYYFHRTVRCDNCLLFEAYTDSLVNAAFQTELSEGALEWHVVNLDDDGNEVFVDRYALEGITLLSKIVVDGEEREWRPLDGIWWLVDDREAFADYVAAEVEADLKRTHDRHEPEAAGSLSLYRELVPESDGGGVDAASSR